MHICVPQKKIYSLLNDHRTLNRFQWSSYSPSGCMHLAFFGIQDKSIWKEDRNHLYPRCYVGVMGFSAMPRSKTKTPSHASKPRCHCERFVWTLFPLNKREVISRCNLKIVPFSLSEKRNTAKTLTLSSEISHQFQPSPLNPCDPYIYIYMVPCFTECVKLLEKPTAFFFHACKPRCNRRVSSWYTTWELVAPSPQVG